MIFVSSKEGEHLQLVIQNNWSVHKESKFVLGFILPKSREKLWGDCVGGGDGSLAMGGLILTVHRLICR